MGVQSRIATSLGVVMMFASVSFAQHVKTDYDHNANFGRFHTFSWGRVQTQNPLWEDRIKQAVGSALSAKGWQEVPSGGDTTVNAFGMTQQRQTLETYYTGFPGWRWGGFGDAITTADTYTQGTLVVDIFDSNNKHLLWRGSSTGTLSSIPDKNIKTLDKDVNAMFDHFPPNH
jgi:hypothetical protein